MRVDASVEKAQVEQVKRVREERSAESASRALSALSKAAGQPKENLIPFILDAVKAEATLGKISDALRAVLGEHRENVVL